MSRSMCYYWTDSVIKFTYTIQNSTVSSRDHCWQVFSLLKNVTLEIPYIIVDSYINEQPVGVPSMNKIVSDLYKIIVRKTCCCLENKPKFIIYFHQLEMSFVISRAKFRTVIVSLRIPGLLACGRNSAQRNAVLQKSISFYKSYTHHSHSA